MIVNTDQPALRPSRDADQAARWTRWLVGLQLAAACLIVLSIALPLLTGKLYVVGDLLYYHLPTRKFYAECLKRGVSPLWWPNVHCGYYLHGEGQVGMFHPLHWLLYRTLPLTTALNLEVVLSYPVAAAGMFALLRRRELPNVAAVFGAVLFAFSGFMVLRLGHVNMVAVMAHLPWLLWTIDVVLADDRARRVAWGRLLFVGVLASMMLLGHPQAVWLCAIISLFYAAILVAARPSVRRVVELTACVALGLLIGSVQWWPSWEMVATSHREGATTEFRSEYSLHPVNLLQYVAPYLFHTRVLHDEVSDNNTHELALYAGAVVPVLVIWALVRFRELRPWRTMLVGALALAALGLLLAFGKHLPPLHALVLRLPIAGLFRCPARYAVLAYFGLAIVSAVAFADLVGVAWSKRKQPWRGISLLFAAPLASALIFAWAVWMAPESKGDGVTWRVESMGAGLAGVGLSVCAAALVIAAARGVKFALAALVLLVAADLCWYGVSHTRVAAPQSFDQILDAVARVPHDAQQRLATVPQLNLATLRNERLFQGYTALVPRRALLNDPNWLLHHLTLVLRLAAVDVLDYQGQLVPVPDTFPRARLVSVAQPTEDPKQDLLTIDPAVVALVDRPVKLDGGTHGTARIVSEQPGRISIDTQAPCRQLLVISESWHRGWHAKVNRVPAQVIRTYGDFMGCEVPAGMAQVELRFLPRSLQIARWLAAGAICATAVWLGISRWLGRGHENNPKMDNAKYHSLNPRVAPR